MSSSLTTLVPTLNGASNYQEWAALMKSFLQSQGKWRLMNKTRPAKVEGEDSEAVDNWDDNNDQAIGSIRLRLSPNIAFQFRDTQTA